MPALRELKKVPTPGCGHASLTSPQIPGANINSAAIVSVKWVRSSALKLTQASINGSEAMPS
jgi:hypothetical protein